MQVLSLMIANTLAASGSIFVAGLAASGNVQARLEQPAEHTGIPAQGDGLRNVA